MSFAAPKSLWIFLSWLVAEAILWATVILPITFFILIANCYFSVRDDRASARF